MSYGDVALAHEQQSELRLRPREHRAPGLERRSQPLGARRPTPSERREVLVEARVVRHVAAAAQDETGRDSRQPLGHVVEVGASAGGEDDLLASVEVHPGDEQA